MNIIALYVDGRRYVLDDTSEILTRANQALATLERYKSRFDEVDASLFALEIENLVTVRDIATTSQRLEMVRRIASEIENYVVELGVEATTISPGFSYERAPKQHVFLQRQATRQLFRDIFKLGAARRGARKWRLNHSSLYLDFLAGNQNYQCSPWGSPARNVFGWQKPCYLMADEGYAPSFSELMQDTPWEKYGSSNHPKCAQCMAHCGYEPTAVNAVMANPLKAAWVALRGPRTEGPMVDNDVPPGPVGAVREHPVHFLYDASRAGSGLQAQVSPNQRVLIGDPEAVADPAVK
jgi:hypothetical protein